MFFFIYNSDQMEQFACIYEIEVAFNFDDLLP